MHPRIHVCSIIYVQKEIITCHASSNHPSYSIKSLKIISKNKEIKKKVSNDNFLCKSHQCLAFTRCLSTLQKQNSSSHFIHQDPLQGNGHWFLMSHWGPLRGNGYRYFYMKTLCEAMVIYFLCHIEALCEAIFIDLLTSRSSARQSSLISYVTSRSSARQWSSIYLHQDPLRSNSHWFLMSYRGPLQGNCHWFLCQIVTLYTVMVTKSFGYRPSPRDWSNLFSKSQKNRKISDRNLYMVMVAESIGSRPSPRDWSNLVFSINKKKQKELVCEIEILYLVWSSLSSNLSSFETRTKLVFLSLLIFYYDKMEKSNFHII